MGASFRNIGEITELAGCDFLTISPSLLEELMNSSEQVTQKLDAANITEKIEKVSYIDNHSDFLFALNTDPMATEKLYSGIAQFAKDAQELKTIIAKKIAA